MMTTLERWFGVEEHWERPRPGPRELRRDVRWALLALLVIAVSHELARSMGMLSDPGPGVGWQYLGIVTVAALVAVRRRHPEATALVAGVHMMVLSVVMPMTMAQLPMQMLYFLLIFSGMAWARNRRVLMGVIAAILVLLVLLFSWSFALSSGIQEIYESLGAEDLEGAGLVPAVPAVILFTVVSNALFFGFAIVLGQVAWNGALRQSQVLAQSETIHAQTAQLTDQAVVAERLRIARELHDVVAHHVSVMGVQAAAARRVLDRDPEAARTAVTAIEQSSRDAVGQMRDLLGTLRTGSEPGDDDASGNRGGAGTDRAPQPTLAALPALVEQATTPTCAVSLDVVESSPGAARRVAPPVQLTAYRIVQEGLANVRRHSTARQARATVRVDEAAEQLEVEIVDDGSPRVGTSGTGLGLMGMRERAQHLGGGVEAGPRQAGAGWRVRVWLPIDGRGPRRTGRSQADARSTAVSG
ncbi:sensor histidine kinase [Ornithinimicrobium sp. LYQ92]|uniref:sensor histidine kinase n=1 Tax=Serinicoccus sp. LYQ92 TaxID=3378798 RepID=UPI0038537C8D